MAAYLKMAAMWKVTCVVFSFFAIFAVLVDGGNKYSKEKNKMQNKKEMENPYRMQKLNLVWQKGKRRLATNELEELYVDLKIQDKLELEAKKKWSDGYDEDGEFAAYARAKLNEILERHGLIEHFERRQSNNVPDENESWKDADGKVGDWQALKMDAKLGKLWKKAKATGFTDEELMNLRTEFMHYSQKMDQFQLLSNEINAFDAGSDGKNENTGEGFEKKRANTKQRKMLNQDLKSKNQELKDDYERLQRLMDTDSKDVQFSDPKVIELWIMAKKSNFTEVELSSFKEELAHFEHKIKKHAYFEDQVRLSEESYRRPDKLNKMPPKHSELEEKAKNYGYKVKKIHRELKTRISKVLGIHSEL